MRNKTEVRENTKVTNGDPHPKKLGKHSGRHG